MIWRWDASTSPDVLAYIFSLALMKWIGNVEVCDPECHDEPIYEVGQMIDVAETPDTFIEYDPPSLPPGDCWMVNVDAIDKAGNRSPR